jgi:hypothetical protein
MQRLNNYARISKTLILPYALQDMTDKFDLPGDLFHK